jgi:ribosome biogenesis GTPase
MLHAIQSVWRFNTTDMTLLEQFGWNLFHQQHYNTIADKEQLPGRVISVQGFKYLLITEKGEIESELSGKLLYATEPEDLPKVGDWVLYLDYGDTGYITEVLPRINALSRKNPGARTERQVMATNIDCAMIVQGLDRDFNLMRLDRYLLQVTSCGISPVVILNKVDLVTDPSSYREEVASLGRNCAVFMCSTYSGEGCVEVKNFLQPAKTYILLGSSGVGKSSLLNIFLNQPAQKTGATSEANNKGKHTTTTRDLFQLDNGSLMIDTPGMREFGVTAESVTNSDVLFPAIQVFASQCRYADCKHINEAGCAVTAAVFSGTLDSSIYENYVKLMKEQRRFEISAEDKKRLGKQSGKMSREAKNHRKRHKF